MSTIIPLVTVYITNHNYEQYVEQSIQSVLNQTMQDFELIIIDDGSTDNSREIIEEYRCHSNVRILYQDNKGLNATNNVAVKEAKGKYIMRLDADDFLEPAALGILVSLMEADPDLGLVFPDYYYVDSNNNRTGLERRHHFDDEVTLYDQPAHGACTMIRLEFLKALGGYDETLTCQDGYEIWLKFITFYKITNVSRPLFSYRRHNFNLTSNESQILETRKIIKEKFVCEHCKLPRTVAVIPIRSKFFGKVNWPFWEYAGKSIIEHKVYECLKAKRITHVIIVSAEDEILEFAQDRFKNYTAVSVIRRPLSYALAEVSLKQTVELALLTLSQDVDLVTTISIDYPFLKASTMDEAINTQVIFKASSVISTQIDLNTYYQHTGKSLKPILDQDKHTRYEREALYKNAGGIIVSKIDSFHLNGSMISGDRLAHVALCREEAWGIHYPFDFKVFNALMNCDFDSK